MITALVTLLIGVLVIGVLIAFNGYFVAQEFAFMSVDRTVLRRRADDGDKRAMAALGVTDRTSFMLSGAQLGITVTGLLVGFAAEPLVGRQLGVLLGGAGVPVGVSVAVGTVLALAVSTIVQMIFGELYPKNLAIANARRRAATLRNPFIRRATANGSPASNAPRTSGAKRWIESNPRVRYPTLTPAASICSRSAAGHASRGPASRRRRARTRAASSTPGTASRRVR